MITFDSFPGGISTMLLNASKVYTFNGWILDVAIPKNAYAASSLFRLSESYSNLSILALNKLHKLLIVFGLKLLFPLLPFINSYNLIIVHNAKLIKPLKKLFNNIPIIAFNHTGKIRQINSYIYADHTFTVNKTIASNINKIKGNSSHTTCIPNAIFNLPEYKICYSNSKPLVIGSLGRFVTKKGLDILIKACSNIHNIELYLGGDGPLKNTFQKMQKIYALI